MPDTAQQLHEPALVLFIASPRRERYSEFLTKESKRAKFLERLPHFPDWDARYTIAIESRTQTASHIALRLKELGAPDDAWIISAVQRLDKQQQKLTDAIDAVVGLAEGTVISCIPGRLAYYEGEDEGTRIILHRR